MTLVCMVSKFLSGFYFADREPGILQKGSGSASVGRNDNCQFVRAFQFTDIEVLIDRACVPFSRHNPDLEKFYRFYGTCIHFAVEDTCSGTHCLDFSHGDDAAVLFTVTMLQMSFQWNGDNFHILVRMRLESFSGCHFVVIQYTKCTEVDTVGIEIFIETESVVTIQPLIFRMSSCICFMYNFLHNVLLFLVVYMPYEQRGWGKGFISSLHLAKAYG